MSEQILYAVAIGRVSTQKQGVFGDSLGDQITQTELVRARIELQEKCRIKIIKTFEFSESASVDFAHQPLQKVLEFCKKSEKRVRFVFIKSIDRGSRAGYVVLGQLMIEFAKIGIDIVDAYGIMSSQKTNTLEHLGIEFPWSIYQPSAITTMLEAERAKGEVRDIQTRMIGASIRYVRLGYWRGSTSLGYKTERVQTDEHGKRLVLMPEPDESIWIREMFELSAMQNKSEQEIVDIVNNLGFRTRTLNYHDKENRNKTVSIKGKLILTPKMLSKYIQNPIYAGVNTEHWLTLNGLLTPIYIKGESIVSVDLFNKANSGKITIIDEDGHPKVYQGIPPDWQKHKLKLNPKYPYKQYILCPICKKHLKGSSSKGKLKSYPIYHCSINHKYVGINAVKLDKIIETFLKGVRFSDEFKEKFEANFIKNWNLRMEQLNKNAINWERRIIDLRNEKKINEDKLKMASTETGIHLFEEEIDRVKQEIANVTIERSKTEDEEVDIQVLTNTAKYWMEHFEELVLTVPNPLVKASLFGQIFEELPTLEELKNRTPKLSHLFALSACHTKGCKTLGGR